MKQPMQAIQRLLYRRVLGVISEGGLIAGYRRSGIAEQPFVNRRGYCFRLTLRYRVLSRGYDLIQMLQRLIGDGWN